MGAKNTTAVEQVMLLVIEMKFEQPIKRKKAAYLVNSEYDGHYDLSGDVVAFVMATNVVAELKMRWERRHGDLTSFCEMKD